MSNIIPKYLKEVMKYINTNHPTIKVKLYKNVIELVVDYNESFPTKLDDFLENDFALNLGGFNNDGSAVYYCTLLEAAEKSIIRTTNLKNLLK